MGDVKRGRARTLLEECACIFHELVEVEVDANRTLQHLQLKLLEEQVVTHALRDLVLAWGTRGDRQRLNGLYDEVTGKVAAHEADHLVVVQGCDCLVVWRRVEDLLHLLEE